METWANIAISAVVGTSTGLASSFGVWWYVTQRLQPSLQWVDHIESRTAESYTGYRARLENSGGRSVYDVEITANLVIERLVPGERQTNLAFATRNLPVLRPTTDSEPGHLINVGPQFLDPTVLRRRQPFVPQPLIDRLVRWEHVPLEELLNLGSNGWVEVTAYSRDVFSGSRTVTTKTFGPNDILESPRPSHGPESEAPLLDADNEHLD